MNAPKNVFVIIAFLLMLKLPHLSNASANQKTCLSRLLPFINNNWEQYVLYFYTSPKTEHDDRMQPDASIFARYVTVESFQHSTAVSKLNRGNYRFSDTFNVVIAPLVYYQIKVQYYVTDVVQDFTEKLVPSRSLFLYIWEHSPEWIHRTNLALASNHLNLEMLPSLKLILTLPPNLECEPTETTVNVLCSRYCSPFPKILTDFEKEFKEWNFESIHKSHFWSAYGKIIPAIISLRYSFVNNLLRFEYEPCLSSKVRISHECNTNLMSTLLLGEVHNITLHLYYKSGETTKMFQVNSVFYGPEHISAAVTILGSPTELLTIVGKIAFHNFGSSSIQYCAKSLEEKQQLLAFQVWYEPFTTDTWVIMLIILSLAALWTFKLKQKIIMIVFELLNYLGSIFGASTKPRHFIVICSLGFLLTQIYGNGLASIITVPSIKKGFKTFKELVDHNYTIAWTDSSDIHTTLRVLKEEMESLGIPSDKAFDSSGKFNNILNSGYSHGMISVKILKEFSNGTRFALMVNTLFSKYYIAWHTFTMRRYIDPSFSCFILDQKLAFRLRYWVLNTQNRYWLKTTIRRMMVSGLYEKWDEWSVWRAMIGKGLMDQKMVPKSDKIDYEKFFCIQLIWGSFLVISLVVFWIEIRLHKLLAEKCVVLKTRVVRAYRRLLRELKRGKRERKQRKKGGARRRSVRFRWTDCHWYVRYR
ncbi:unnamed protein product [Orchesella dallaii]|uniref:Uncharacterized protein n=1 Tax=Orchesella dallaii TaxID=48710 RepID=A0ABP1QM12_9HEXA